MTDIKTKLEAMIEVARKAGANEKSEAQPRRVERFKWEEITRAWDVVAHSRDSFNSNDIINELIAARRRAQGK